MLPDPCASSSRPLSWLPPVEKLTQTLPQRAPAAVDSRLHRSFRDSQDVGDLLVRTAFDVEEHDRHAQVLGKLEQRLLHRALHLSAVGGGFGIGGRDRTLVSHEMPSAELFDARASASEAPATIERRVRRDAIEERREACLAPEAMPVAVQAEERLL